VIFFKVTPPVGFEPAILGFEAKEHLRNRMCKENCRKRLSKSINKLNSQVKDGMVY